MPGPSSIDPERVAVYIRWSTDDQGEGTTLAVQRERCIHYLRSQGWQFDEGLLYVDDGYSGGTLERPALARLRADVGAGRVACVVVYKIDRLSRSVVDIVDLVLREWEGRCFVKSTTEEVNTLTPAGKVFFYILVSFAEYERNVIRERTMGGKVKRAEQGLNPGFRPPFGYRRGALPGQMEVVAHEAGLVRRIFDLRKQGYGPGQIAHLLNEEGLRRRGSPWNPQVIRRMLVNPAYVGRLEYGRSMRTTREQRVRQRVGGLIRFEEPRFARVDGAFPAIVEHRVWEQVQRRRCGGGGSGGGSGGGPGIPAGETPAAGATDYPGTPASADLATPTSADMATPTSADMAAPAGADMATSTGADLAAPTGADPAAPTSTDLAAPTSTDLAAPIGAYLAAPTGADPAAPTSADLATSTSADLAAPTGAYLAAPTGALSGTGCLLAGLAVCRCGAPLGRKQVGSHTYYYCTRRKRLGSSVCDAGHVPAAPVDAEVERRVRPLLANLLHQIRPEDLAASVTADLADRLRMLAAERLQEQASLRSIRDRQRRLSADYRNGLLPAHLYAQESEAIGPEETASRARLANIHQAAVHLREVQHGVQLKMLVPGVDSLWEDLTLSERKQMLRMTLRLIRLYRRSGSPDPATLELKWVLISPRESRIY